jgi:hypothetical protein
MPPRWRRGTIWIEREIGVLGLGILSKWHRRNAGDGT